MKVGPSRRAGGRAASLRAFVAGTLVLAACGAPSPPVHTPERAAPAVAPTTLAHSTPAPPPFTWRDGAAQLRARSIALASLTADPDARGEALVAVLRALDAADPRAGALLARLSVAIARQPPPAPDEAHERDALVARELFLAERLLDRGEGATAPAVLERLAAAPPRRSEARATLARLLVRIGARDRALLLARTEEASEAPEGESDDEDEEDTSDADVELDDEVLAAIGSEEATRGDLDWVAREVIPHVAASHACPVLAAVGARHQREGRRAEAEVVWTSIRLHLAEHGEPEGAAATVACLAAEVRARLAHGDRAGAAASLAVLGRAEDEAACRLLVDLRREVDPTLLDVPVEVALHASAHEHRFAWDGCPTALAEALVRRGDRRRAMGLVARWRGNGVKGRRGLSDGPEWPVLLRLGHLQPHEVVGLSAGGWGPSGNIVTELELARILDEGPDRPLDRDAFDASFPPIASP